MIKARRSAKSAPRKTAFAARTVSVRFSGGPLTTRQPADLLGLRARGAEFASGLLP